MKKQISIISAVVTTALIAGMTVMPVFAETQEKDETAAGIQVYTGFSFQQEWSEEAGRALAQSVCPKAALDDETAAAWPELDKAFAALNEEKKKDADKTYQTTLADAKERLREDPEYTTTFTDSESFCVVRADSRIVSLLGVYNGYTGGAHGYEGFSGVNIDPASGKTLALSDVVTDSATFTALVKEELLRLYPDVDKDLTDRYFEETAIDDMIWTAACDGVTCYFNAYTLGAYALGYQIVPIPYAGNEALFTEAVTDAPDSFGIEFPMRFPVKLGGREILVTGTPSKYGSYDSLSIYLDGEENRFEDDIYTYAVHPTYFNVEGEEYLMLEYSEDNDYRCIDLYRLGEKVERIGLEDLSRAGIYKEEMGNTAYAALTNPEHLPLSKRTNLLGTASIMRISCLHKDGTITPEEPYFRYIGTRVLTTNEDLTCKEADEAGTVTGDLTVPAGTKLTPFRTDNESIVDLRTEDGRIARVEVAGGSYPQTIDGKDISEIFDGVRFAG